MAFGLSLSRGGTLRDLTSLIGASILELWTPEEVVDIQWEGRERCGVVVEWRNLEARRFIEVENIAPEPARWFEMPGVALTRIRGVDSWDIVGVWHTHPPGLPQPSTTDLEWTPANLEMYILCEGVLRQFDSTGKEVG